jgi:thiamine biosynthesis lipoprotein
MSLAPPTTTLPGGVRADAPPPTERREGRAMGSPLRLQVAGGARTSRVDAAWSAVVAEFEATEQALSRFRPTSEIHGLRLAGGRSAMASRRLVAALSAADRARRVTGGRFDPRVLDDLERLGSRPIDVPASLARGRPDPAVPVVRRTGRQGSVDVPVPIDFGGIGKGLALRWAARRAAAALGGPAFLIEAGGDIVGHGSPGAGGWRVGIEDPRSASEPVGDLMARAEDGSPVVVVELRAAGGAIATSSVRRARWRSPDGRIVHHLIDPRSGEPGREDLLAVTVAAPDPAWAEVWSKALFLEGRAGIAVVARAKGLAAWWVAADGAVEMTAGARLLTIWVGDEV